MKHLVLHSGGTKIVADYEFASHFRDIKFDIISGNSEGAVLCVPVAMGKWNEIEKFINDLSVKHFMSRPVINDKGRVTVSAIVRAILQKPNLGFQSKRLKETLSKVISFEDFNEYKVNDKYAKCIVGYVDSNAKRHYVNLKHLSYEAFLSAVAASSAIPCFTEGEMIHGELMWDGGLRDYNASEYVLDNFDVKEEYSSYVLPDMRHPTKLDKKHWIHRFLGITEVLQFEETKNTQKNELEFCEAYNIKLHSWTFPNLLNHPYDTNKKRLRAQRDAVINIMKNGL